MAFGGQQPIPGIQAVSSLSPTTAQMQALTDIDGEQKRAAKKFDGREVAQEASREAASEKQAANQQQETSATPPEQEFASYLDSAAAACPGSLRGWKLSSS